MRRAWLAETNFDNIILPVPLLLHTFPFMCFLLDDVQINNRNALK